MSVIDDVAQYLVDNGIGALGTTIFKSYLPDNVDAALVVLDTGGIKPDGYIPTKTPTFEILIRAADYTTGKAKLDSIRSLLHSLKNTTVGSTYFYYILAIAEGGHLGRNERGLDEFSINFQCLTR